MQRLLMLFVSLVASAALGSPASAQPVPDPQPPVEAAPASEPAAAPPVAPTAVDVAAPPVPAAKPVDDLPRKLAVGKDSPGAFFTPGLLLQGWFVQDFASTPANAAGESTTVSPLSTFRIRRAEISANGELIPKFLKYRMMLDPARVRDTPNRVTIIDGNGMPVVVSTPPATLSVLQDFYITFQSAYADVSIGQFKIPVSWEGFNSSAKLILPERAFVANLLGDKRDLGVRVEKTFEKFGYAAGIFNGRGLDQFDDNNQKDLALRLEVYPVKGMTIAGVGYGSVGYRTRAGTKDRWEGDFRYETGPWLVQAEYIRAVDTTRSGATECANAAGKCTAHGAYAALAYKLRGVGSGAWKGDFQPVVRVGFFDPDVDNDVTAATPAENGRVDYEVGANYYLRNHEAKLQLSYDRQQFSDTDLRPANNEVILAAQVSY